MWEAESGLEELSQEAEDAAMEAFEQFNYNNKKDCGAIAKEIPGNSGERETLQMFLLAVSE